MDQPITASNFTLTWENIKHIHSRKVHYMWSGPITASNLSSIYTPCSGATSAQWFIILTCLSCNALTVCTSSSHVLHNVETHCWHLLIKMYIVSNTYNILYTIFTVKWTQAYNFFTKIVKNNSRSYTWFAYLIKQSVGFWHLQHTCTERGSENLFSFYYCLK